MKRILLFILLLIGTGCKVTQQPVNKAEQQPDSSIQSKPEEVLYAVADSINKTKEEVLVSHETDSLSVDIKLTDSLHIHTDSIAIMADNGQLPSNSLTTDSVPRKKGALEATVDYQANDSIVWTAGNMAYLFGEGDVKYQSIELKSEIIQMKMDSSILYAVHGVDSLGVEFGHPVFTEGDQNFDAKEMHYNFKTRKALARNVVTQQGEGFVTASMSKKMPDDVINMIGGKYTTCDDPECPHFYVALTKAKTRPGKNIVTGPAYLVIEDVPLFPLVLPFAFFPFTDTYSSGILMPTYGDDMNKGFFLHNGGYYFALSDYFDFALTGEMYTKGSWGLTGRSSYRKRYKYSGSFDLSFATTKLGDKGLDDYSVSKDFKVRLSHSQDPKANPYRTISASVDYSTSSYDRNNLTTMYTSAATQNNKGSSVSLSQRFPNKPISITATMNINQRSQDSTIALTLPDMTVSMTRIYPLKRKTRVGKELWYEKISIDYNGQLRNSVTTKDNQLFEANIIRDWKNGIQHRSSVNATYNIFEHINISPNISYTERWTTNKVIHTFDHKTNRIVPYDTIYGFYRLYEYNASVSASTTLYGTFVPIKPLRKIVKTIRHRMEPSISFSAKPDFGDPRYGFYQDIVYFEDDIDDPLYQNYTPFAGGLFGVPGKGRSGNISFTLNNNFEAKVPDAEEPSGESKISLIDNLSGSMGYNMAVDSFNWSDLTTSLRLKITKNYTLNLSAMFDTYAYEYDEKRNQLYRVDKLRLSSGKGIGRLKTTGTSFSYTFNNDTFKKKSGSDRNKKNRSNNMDMMEEDEYDPDDPFGQEEDMAEETDRNRGGLRNREKQSEGEYDEDGYYNVTIPWTFSFNYNLAVGYDMQKIDIEKKEYKYKFTHALSFNGSIQPTKNWRINFNATYDVENKKISYMTCNISRSMHCFQMSASVIPVGYRKSYSFSISANSSMLKDLKYDQRSQGGGANMWY